MLAFTRGFAGIKVSKADSKKNPGRSVNLPGITKKGVSPNWR